MTEGELYAASVGTVVLDCQDNAWQKMNDGLWMCTLHDLEAGSGELHQGRGPVRLIWGVIE